MEPESSNAAISISMPILLRLAPVQKHHLMHMRGRLPPILGCLIATSQATSDVAA
jgi:hypothetical protein